MRRAAWTLVVVAVAAALTSSRSATAEKEAAQPYFGTGDSGTHSLTATAYMNNAVPAGKRLVVAHVSLHVVQPVTAPGARCRIFGQGPDSTLVQHDLVPQVVWMTATFQRRSASTPMSVSLEPGFVALECDNLVTGFDVRVEGSVSGQLVPM